MSFLKRFQRPKKDSINPLGLKPLSREDVQAADATKRAKMVTDFPGVRVVKIWHTCNDDHVCDVCRPLSGKEVGADAEFAPGIKDVPAHEGCRCYVSSRTRI